MPHLPPSLNCHFLTMYWPFLVIISVYLIYTTEITFVLLMVAGPMKLYNIFFLKKITCFFFKVSYLIVWTQTFTRMEKFVSAFLEPGVAKEPKPGPPIQICFSFLSPYKDLFWFRSLILMKLVTNDKKEHNKDWKIHECTMRWWS